MPTSRSLNDHFQPLSRNRNYLSPQLRVDWSVNRFCGRRKRTRKVKNTSSLVKKHQQHHHSFCRSATFVLVPFATRRSLLQFDLNGLPINFDLICCIAFLVLNVKRKAASPFSRYRTFVFISISYQSMDPDTQKKTLLLLLFLVNYIYPTNVCSSLFCDKYNVLIFYVLLL